MAQALPDPSQSILGAPSGGGGDSEWVELSFSEGTVYGNAAVVVAADGNTVEVDHAENAAAFLDNSPDNRSDYWFRSTAVDLSKCVSGPVDLNIDMTLPDVLAHEGLAMGMMLHNAEDPTLATRYAGLWVQDKTNTDGTFWGINSWGQLSGNAGIQSSRQRFVGNLTIDSDRLKILSWASRSVTKEGVSTNSAINQRMVTSESFDITGGLWVSLILGTYQPSGSPPAAQEYEMVQARYRVTPMNAP